MGRIDRPRVLLDACAFIAVIRDEPDADRLDGLMAMIANDDVQLVESVIILGEVFRESQAEDQTTRDEENRKLRNIRALLESRAVELLDVTPPIIRKAVTHREERKMSLPDAIHLAAAELNRCDWFVSFDENMKIPYIPSLRIFRSEQLRDRSVELPWDLPGQDELPAELDNVIPIARGNADEGTSRTSSG